jgi:hypothetical protein
LGGCSKSNDQRDFEDEALTQPQGITETNANGDVQNTDPDDWRIAPMYRGLVSIGTPDNQPPYPNPLSYNQDLTINIYIRSIETLNEIVVRSFEFPSQANAPAIAIREELSSPTLETITLSGQTISGSSGGQQAAGTYRILIYDGKQNLITYGDIRIE